MTSLSLPWVWHSSAPACFFYSNWNKRYKTGLQCCSTAEKSFVAFREKIFLGHVFLEYVWSIMAHTFFNYWTCYSWNKCPKWRTTTSKNILHLPEPILWQVFDYYNSLDCSYLMSLYFHFDLFLWMFLGIPWACSCSLTWHHLDIPAVNALLPEFDIT